MPSDSSLYAHADVLELQSTDHRDGDQDYCQLITHHSTHSLSTVPTVNTDRLFNEFTSKLDTE